MVRLLPSATKPCRTCGRELPATHEHFYRNRANKDGLDGRCRECGKGASKKYAAAHREERKQYNAEWRAAHRDSVRAYAHEYNQKRKAQPKQARETRTCTKCSRALPATPEFFHQQALSPDGLRATCKTCYLAAAKEYREGNRPQVLQRTREWRRKNRDYVLLYAREHSRRPEVKLRNRIAARERYRNDPQRRLNVCVASGIGISLRGGKRGERWESLVDFSLDELRAHLESLFEPGMTWSNYGKKGWEIDHVRPIASFTFASAKDPEFSQCWALANLQPMWQRLNARKGSKMPVVAIAEMMAAMQGGAPVGV